MATLLKYKKGLKRPTLAWNECHSLQVVRVVHYFAADSAVREVVRVVHYFAADSAVRGVVRVVHYFAADSAVTSLTSI